MKKEQGKLPPDQYGFFDLGTINNRLTKFQNNVRTKINTGGSTIAMPLDVAIAFDTTWTQGLIFKMKQIHHFEDHICRIIYHFTTKNVHMFGDNFSINDSDLEQISMISRLLTLSDI